MRIFVAGASGALGRPLVRLLLKNGHQVTGLTHSRPQLVADLGATPVQANALEAAEIEQAVSAARPDAVVHLMSKVPETQFVTPPQFQMTNALRTIGTENLLAAAAIAGVPRVLAASATFLFKGRSEENMEPYRRVRGREIGTFDPWTKLRPMLDAITELETRVTAANGTIFRFGHLYGPGTVPTDVWPRALRRRSVVMLGKGTAWWSFIHVDDAATAMAKALEHGAPLETFNICDDEPILAREAFEVVSKATGRPRPWRLKWGPMMGQWWFNQLTGASNEKAKEELGLTLQYPSFTLGYPKTL